jgi:hypothetical protein
VRHLGCDSTHALSWRRVLTRWSIASKNNARQKHARCPDVPAPAIMHMQAPQHKTCWHKEERGWYLLCCMPHTKPSDTANVIAHAEIRCEESRLLAGSIIECSCSTFRARHLHACKRCAKHLLISLSAVPKSYYLIYASYITESGEMHCLHTL